MHLPNELILLSARPTDKSEAISLLAKRLTESGFTSPEYAKGMFERESQENTYLGKGIAIPHGTPQTRQHIKQTAIVVMQIPDGVLWGENGEKVYLAIGIAASGDEHLQVLKKLTRLLNNATLLDELIKTDNPELIRQALSDSVQSSSNDLPQKSVHHFAYKQTVVLPNPQGMHARPATRLAKLSKTFDASVYIETQTQQQANTEKMFEVLALGLVQGSELIVLSDSEFAMTSVVEAIKSGLGDDLSISAILTKSVNLLWEPEGEITTFQGVGASDGLVIGNIYRYGQQHFKLPETVLSPLEEAQNFDDALQASALDIHALMGELSDTATPGIDQSAIFDAHLALLNDSDIITETTQLIAAGDNAATAYKAITDQRIADLSAVADSNIAARAADIRDVRNRVMNALLGLEVNHLDFDEPVILCAEDLTPSDTARLNPAQVLGFITAMGGPTSHSAIIARGMGLPAVVAAGSAVRSITDGTPIILDGNAGCVYVEPTEQQLQSAKIAQNTARVELEKALEKRMKKGQTADGSPIEIAANINRASAAIGAIEAGAQGVGLMRTEFLYLERNSIPSEDEQEAEYRAMAEALGDKPLIIRTLDIGGDKEVPYLGLAHEDNAFLGVRGIRLCFERPDLFIPQLRAICRVAKDYNNIRVMFPMIGKLADWSRAKAMLDSSREDIGAPEFPVGIMIEVPSAALMAPQLAPEVDFFSIGTNDLTQYTLAMDRMHPMLAAQADALHPAVLRLIDMTVKAASAQGKWVGVCGGAAGEAAAAKILVGLGVSELSMSPPQIALVKQMLREHNLAQLQNLAQQALQQDSGKAVRQLLTDF